jgi:O-acetyl-ADP-ribose deacetylase (regulator of RNase III)
MSVPSNVTIMSEEDNIIHSEAEWLVCPTNAVGTMGAGLAKYFSLVIPHLLADYKKHCAQHEPIHMRHFVFQRPGSRNIYCFHTKCDWRENSSLRIIKSGLKKLEDWIKSLDEELVIESIAIPALGCGKGQLDWDDVLPLMNDLAKRLPNVEFEFYPPK